jgi:glycosyltransferase involved in cell wall biosynthesis
MIAWVSHHLPDANGKLVGGAEMTDVALLENAPIPVKVIHSDNWKEALDFDKVIITGTDLLSSYAMNKLAMKKPVVAVHHLQTRSLERAQLLNSASTLICHTPKHLELELSWVTPKRATWIISPHDPGQFSSKPKENFALWAARLHPQKGPMEAMEWASKRSIPLLMMYDKTREEVLEAMSRARDFVFLPTSFDAEPRTIIEAVLSGCKVFTNELAGISSIPNWENPEVISDLVSNSKELFWETVLH